MRALLGASLAGEEPLEGSFDAECLDGGVALDGEVLQASGQLRLDVDQDPAFALAAAARIRATGPPG